MINNSTKLIRKVETRQSSKIWIKDLKTAKKCFINRTKSSRKCIKISQTF